MKASSTVEATLIIPVILFMIFAVIRLTFFMYARIKLEADSDRAVTEASQVFIKAGKADADMLPADLPEKYLRNYPYYVIEEMGMELDHTELKAAAALQSNILNTGLSGLFTQGMNTARCRVSMKYWDCPRVKRVIDIIMRMKQEEADASENSE